MCARSVITETDLLNNNVVLLNSLVLVSRIQISARSRLEYVILVRRELIQPKLDSQSLLNSLQKNQLTLPSGPTKDISKRRAIIASDR